MDKEHRDDDVRETPSSAGKTTRRRSETPSFVNGVNSPAGPSRATSPRSSPQPTSTSRKRWTEGVFNPSSFISVHPEARATGQLYEDPDVDAIPRRRAAINAKTFVDGEGDKENEAPSPDRHPLAAHAFQPHIVAAPMFAPNPNRNRPLSRRPALGEIPLARFPEYAGERDASLRSPGATPKRKFGSQDFKKSPSTTSCKKQRRDQGEGPASGGSGGGAGSGSGSGAGIAL
ncbi:hypothetical protein HDU96_003028 [Phlyctochytrium bullatum]|nr:hypothetical protein HDU96_003028 [Phlyctochytrium bullatum]